MTHLIGKKAPDFTAKAVVNGSIVNDFSLKDYWGEHYVVLFFYPKDFTFVCPTEIVAFQERLEDFKSRQVQVVGCSTDTEFSHLAWIDTPREKGGIEGVVYPLVADTNKTIASAYDVLTGYYDTDDEGDLVASDELIAYRGLFLMDKEGIVRHEVINDLPLGRSILETLRMVDALQHFELHGEVCPMDWKKDAEALQPTQESVGGYLASQKSKG